MRRSPWHQSYLLSATGKKNGPLWIYSCYVLVDSRALMSWSSRARCPASGAEKREARPGLTGSACPLKRPVRSRLLRGRRVWRSVRGSTASFPNSGHERLCAGRDRPMGDPGQGARNRVDGWLSRQAPFREPEGLPGRTKGCVSVQPSSCKAWGHPGVLDYPYGCAHHTCL